VPTDAKPTILLVEDFDDAREMYADYLEFSGFHVLTAPDAKRGLELAEARQPDLILMDAGLPGMSGWEACSNLKASPGTRAIPVIMLTGHVFGGSRKQSIQVGADGFLAKPCLPDDLVREIRRALEQPSGEIATAPMAPPQIESGEGAVKKVQTEKPAKRARRQRGSGTS
jgi:CheY-like chemotaxis protein